MSARARRKRKSSLQGQVIGFALAIFGHREQPHELAARSLRERGHPSRSAKCAKQITFSEPTAVQMNQWDIWLCVPGTSPRTPRVPAIGDPELVYRQRYEILREIAAKFPECDLIFAEPGRRISAPCTRLEEE